MKHLEEYLQFMVDVRGHSPATAVNYRTAILDFTRQMGIEDPEMVTTMDLDRYMTRIFAAGRAATTRRNRLHALKSFFKWLRSRDLIARDPGAHAFGPPEKITHRLPVFTTAEIEKLIFRFRGLTPVRRSREPAVLFAKRLRIAILKEKRDSALLALCYTLGLRASEPGLLRREDYQVRNGVPVLTIREAKRSVEPVTLRVDRRVEDLMQTYLEELDRQVRPRHLALFPSIFYETSKEHGISKRQVWNIFARRVWFSGIEAKGRRLSPHCLRYSIATHLSDGRLPLREIQLHLRHRDFETTLRYIRLGSFSAVQKRAVRALYWNRSRLSGAELPQDPILGR